MSGSAYSRSPKLLKGGLVVFGADAPVPTGVISFQLNPEALARRVESTARDAHTAPRAGDASGALGGPPNEAFTLSVELSAIDGLEEAVPLVQAVGLHAQLAQLEGLMHPSSALELLNRGLAAVGIATVRPATVPIVLLFWGPGRVLPVRVSSVAVSEQQFDQLLNPIQAKVDLGLRVLTDDDLATANPIFKTLPLVRSVERDALALKAVGDGAASILGSLSL